MDWQRHTYGSGETANLGYGLKVSVTYESLHRLADGEPRYNIVVFGVRRPTREHDLNEAKKIAASLAERFLREALQNITD